MEGSVSPKSNKLLGLLPDAAYSLLSSQLQFVQYNAGEVLHQPGQPLRYVIYPATGLIGRVAMTQEGKSCDLSLCGRDGVIGVSAFLGGPPLDSLALVLADTSAYRVTTAAVLSVWRSSEAFQWLMLRYAHTMLHEIAHVALCNRHHSVEQQLSRWLLLAMDRLGGSSLQITQATISNMLGVRREGITEAAGKLEALGIVKRGRGGITIVNRARLLARCCECYGATARHFDNLVSEAQQRVHET
jgi:CRP-like cAMP-binding protein